MGKKPFNYSDYWASDIYRTNRNGKEQIAAHVRRRYDEVDVEDIGPGTLIGVDTQPLRRKILDTDQDSTTFGKRIDDPNDDSGRTKRIFTIEWSKKNVENFKKLVGTTRLGTTQFHYIYRERTYTAINIEDFWTKTMNELYNEIVLDKTKILVDIHNTAEKEQK